MKKFQGQSSLAVSSHKENHVIEILLEKCTPEVTIIDFIYLFIILFIIINK